MEDLASPGSQTDVKRTRDGEGVEIRLSRGLSSSSLTRGYRPRVVGIISILENIELQDWQNVGVGVSVGGGRLGA